MRSLDEVQGRIRVHLANLRTWLEVDIMGLLHGLHFICATVKASLQISPLQILTIYACRNSLSLLWLSTYLSHLSMLPRMQIAMVRMSSDVARLTHGLIGSMRAVDVLLTV